MAWKALAVSLVQVTVHVSRSTKRCQSVIKECTMEYSKFIANLKDLLYLANQASSFKLNWPVTCDAYVWSDSDAASKQANISSSSSKATATNPGTPPQTTRLWSFERVSRSSA